MTSSDKTMPYSDKQFGCDLLAQLDQGYDPVRIAEWADRIFLNCEYSNAVRESLIDIFTMQEGEEFHIPEHALRAIAQRFATD